MYLPGIVIAALVLAFTLVGDGLRDALGTRHETRRAPMSDPARSCSVDGLTVRVPVGGRGWISRSSTTCRFDVGRGADAGSVGESGSGKTVTVAGDHGPEPGGSAAGRGGSIQFEGQ